MVAAAKLAFDLTLPLELAGANALYSPDREETWVRRLFERAVGGFYQVVLSPQEWQVRCGTVLDWMIEQKTAGIDQIMPTMRTDIVLDHKTSGRRLVIDTKFASIVTKGWHREETLRSAYVYQIYAYLRSQVGQGDTIADFGDRVAAPSVRWSGGRSDSCHPGTRRPVRDCRPHRVGIEHTISPFAPVPTCAL